MTDHGPNGACPTGRRWRPARHDRRGSIAPRWRRGRSAAWARDQEILLHRLNGGGLKDRRLLFGGPLQDTAMGDAAASRHLPDLLRPLAGVADRRLWLGRWLDGQHNRS